MEDYIKVKSVKLLSENARDKVIEGINRVADAVKVTMGPAGRLVIYDGDFGTMGVTKDGVTVARNIKFSDSEMNLGASLIKQSANQTLKGAGDGTTTTCVLAQSLIKSGLGVANSDINIINLTRKMKSIVENDVIPELTKMKREIDDNEVISSTALMSTNHDEELAAVVTEVFQTYGKEVVVNVENSDTGKTHISVVPGISINRGYTRPEFAPTNNPVTKFENCGVVLMDSKVTNPQLLFTKVIQSWFSTLPLTPLVIIANDFPEGFEADLLVNRAKGIPVLPIRAPYYGQKQKDYLKDIAVFTGAKIISETDGVPLTQVKSAGDVVGTAELVLVDIKSTSFINTRKSDNIEEYVAELRTKLENTKEEYDKNNIRERISKLTAGICSIKVYAETDVELQEKKDRLDDAIKAVKIALDKGLCPGGGSAYYHIARKLSNKFYDTTVENAAKKILIRALKEPEYQLMRNAGLNPEEQMMGIQYYSDYICYNLLNNSFESINTTMILDPIGTLESALRNALSIAIQVLSMGAVISNVAEERKENE